MTRRGSIQRHSAPAPLDRLGYSRFVLTVAHEAVAELILMQPHPLGCEGLLDDELVSTTWAVAGRITEVHDGLWSVPLESVL